MNRTACPDARTWQAILDEESGARAEELAQHLEGCASCLHTLQTLAAEPSLWEEIAGGLPNPTREDPALRGVVERLKIEGPPVCEEDLPFLQPTDRPGLLGLIGR